MSREQANTLVDQYRYDNFGEDDEEPEARPRNTPNYLTKEEPANQEIISKTQRDKMYQDLYHQVMKSKDMKESTHRVGQPMNAFQVYKEGWNKIQDKIDKDYQKKLRQANTGAQQRMQDAKKKKE